MKRVRFVMKANKPVIYDVVIDIEDDLANENHYMRTLRDIWEIAPMSSGGLWKDDPDRQWSMSEFQIKEVE